MTMTMAESPSIDVAQLRQLMHEDPEIRILDVRSGGEFEGGHIPGSYNVPLDTLGEHVDKFADVDRRVILVCQSGGRATKAHEKLADAGKSTLQVLDGGFNSWQTTDGDVAGESNSRWAMDRQVRGLAGLLGLSSVAISTMVPGAKWIAGGVGAGLLYSAVSNTCAMAKMLSKLKYNRSEACDIDAVLADLI